MKATLLLVLALLGIVSCQTCTQSKTVPYSVSASGLTLDLINTYGIPYQVVYSEDTTQIEVYASSDVLLDRISVSTNETNGILQVILDDSCGCYGISGANCDNGTCVCTNTGVAPSGLSCSNPSNPNTDESSFAIGKIAPSFISLAIGYICCLFFANHKQSIFIVLFASILFSSVSMSHSQSNCSDLYVVIKGPITSQLTITTGTTGTMTTGGSTTGGNTAACNMGSSPGSAVQQPVSVATVDGQVSWFASPLIYDLDKDGKNEIIAAYASLYIYDSAGTQITSASGSNRVYAPHVIADLDGDGQVEIVIGNGKYVYAYNYAAKKLSVKSGWPADTTTGGKSPEVRGMSAADLNGDGKIEIIVTTTQTVSASKGGSQVFVFSYDGTLYQPAGGHSPAWPRYNSLTGDGNDADVNIAGQDGYGCYGLNVGVGNIDGDSNLEIIVTYDNHFIQAFKHDGVTINTTPAYTRRETPRNARLTWGQMVRWADYGVEIAQYVNHSGVYPCVCNDPPQEWLQWTASPPSIIDIDLDGQNEVIGIPNIESGEPYVTQAYGVFVIQGDYPGNKSAVRKPGWENFPRGNTPITVEGYYPPLAPPNPSFANLQGDAKLEILAPLNDGFLYCFSSDNQLLWKYDFTHGKTIMFVTEAVVADLNQDGSPEVVFATFGDPNVDSGYLVILDANGNMLFDMLLPDTGYNGNGNGAPAAPTIGDIDGDGTLEILVQTFDHGMNIFNVPGSQTNCVLWPTARGGLLRKGQPDGY